MTASLVAEPVARIKDASALVDEAGDHIVELGLDYLDAVADWFVQVGERHVTAGAIDDGLRYVQTAAYVLIQQSRKLVSPQIERVLQMAAAALSDSQPAEVVGESFAEGTPRSVLHVLDEALPAGGLTAMATRWIQNDGTGRRQSVALLSQSAPVPEPLRIAVANAGGRIFCPKATASLTEKAVWLRRLARRSASHVVLHVSVADVICGAAFGIAGGPPVFTVNHAAHIFWTGATLADAVINCRGSKLESSWTTLHRGAVGVTVPIPLPAPVVPDGVGDSVARQQARERLGLPRNACVILTVGVAFKYLPSGNLDFLDSVERVLTRIPAAVLLAVGVSPDHRWEAASRRVGGRIRPMGFQTQEQLRAILRASDLCVEGFPFGTTTALLEAGIQGIPVVLAPATCPPPYASDGIAFDDLPLRPRDPGEHVELVSRLAADPHARRALGLRVQEAISRHHTGSGWSGHLAEAFRRVKGGHCVRPPTPCPETPRALYGHWAAFVEANGSKCNQALESAIVRALGYGAKPRVDGPLRALCVRSVAVRRGRTVPCAVLWVACNLLLPVVPRRWAQPVFRALSFAWRGRVFRWAWGCLRGHGVEHRRARTWYESYRRVAVEDPCTQRVRSEDRRQ